MSENSRTLDDDRHRHRALSPTIGPGGAIALVAGLAFLVAVVGASVWLAARNAEALEAVSKERAFLNTLVRVGLLVEQAETGQRGFLLTGGRESYLTPFVDAVAQLPSALDAFERSAAGAPEPEARRLAEPLRTAAEDKVAELQQTIGLARDGKLGEALALVQSDRGQRAMDGIRSGITRVQGLEQAMVAGRFEAINQRGRWLVLMAGAALTGVLILAGFIGYGVRRHMVQMRFGQDQLEAANTKLEAGNADLERAVEARTGDLQEANDEIQRFAYIVSHDLRAPLVNIMGFTSELEVAMRRLAAFLAERDPASLPADVAEAANDDIPEALRFIKASTAKMDRLIGAILQLSREGRRVLAPERLETRELLEGVADTLQHQATQRQARITIGDLPPLSSDRLATEQIFANLLDNALKYLDPARPGVVRVDGHLDGRMAVLEVRDNGRGIAQKDHGRVFELFRRAGDQTTPGEGIGLAHVRALVRRLGGRIECESVLGEGTVFRVRLPAAPDRKRSIAA